MLSAATSYNDLRLDIEQPGTWSASSQPSDGIEHAVSNLGKARGPLVRTQLRPARQQLAVRLLPSVGHTVDLSRCCLQTGYGHCPFGHGKSLDPHW